MIDIHSHILPAVDDGAKTTEESLKLLKIAREDGIDKVVLTPHIDSIHYPNTPESLRTAFDRFLLVVEKSGIDIKLYLAAEVMIGPEALILVESGRMPWLGRWDGKKVFLLEFPANSIPFGSLKLVKRLTKMGVCPMIVHPERNSEINRNLGKLSPFLDEGCILQITAKSLEGGFGALPFKAACELVRRNWATVIASDSHNVQFRPPKMSEGVKVAGKIIGIKQARAMANQVPEKLIEQFAEEGE